MRTTLDLPDDLFRQAKIHAAVKGITLKELFTEGLRMALEANPARAPHDSARQQPAALENQSRLP